jgi:hypothetical protein
VAQSRQASVNAAGDSPAVKRAAAAFIDLSITFPNAVDAYESRSKGAGGSHFADHALYSQKPCWPTRNAFRSRCKWLRKTDASCLKTVKRSCRKSRCR